jgi:hypothetical protein
MTGARYEMKMSITVVAALSVLKHHHHRRPGGETIFYPHQY